ncbi:hypothetical protein CLDAP_06410 [Caldilinea aerophila DSM 14535 = NBRC 104270]|uniref:Uncharacterized protein n=1 Tax=Caldilinea aerophila (strain DSM 14535 / JCM 11387 / NBRC 104270 / STL-6-O1) TaxID=926550 RepID=I0I093_CALAS|nr:hypothetical protein CLDAP_06410 [Caldilinea aerophila DSM 14535 = NBRC 104270]
MHRIDGLGNRIGDDDGCNRWLQCKNTPKSVDWTLMDFAIFIFLYLFCIWVI